MKSNGKLKSYFIVLLCIAVVIGGLMLSAHFKPDSYIDAAEEVKKGVVFQIIGYLPLFVFLAAVGIILIVKQIKLLVRNFQMKRRLKFESEINRMREDTQPQITLLTGKQVFIKLIGIIIAAIGFTAIIANTKAFLAEYSTSEKDMGVFRKAGLVLDISSDLKTGETITESYEYIYPHEMTSEVRLKVKNSRIAVLKRSYYVLECVGVNGSRKFPISEQDSYTLSDILLYSDKIEIEYYKNSGLIKSISYDGNDYDLIYSNTPDI